MPQGAPCPNEPRSDSAGRPRRGPRDSRNVGAGRAESAADRVAASRSAVPRGLHEGAATRQVIRSIPEARAAAHPSGGDRSLSEGAAGSPRHVAPEHRFSCHCVGGDHPATNGAGECGDGRRNTPP